ncbi:MULTISPECIES: hypothetical protein [Kitasatospora]|uniref:Uncharacterized protein n=1 Tax=Kitasatospora setae (strain ATCC 33774 / DSM 43861 / JCM 3304 / KCC A-0304 / NBRC 14216 / KM-6054) TaxID=452652 RepID=E4N3D2_KITSK|nr:MULTISPECIES: hypothetical protein [Kitasatospora]BAJ32666.1 hypothetical protein KSE_69080 [Kitasatospora setae KM-6054]
MEWFEEAEQAERRQEWDRAIALVSARAACYSADYHAHDNHLWHLQLLASAGRLEELERLAATDVHARRRLDRALAERGLADALHARAADGDRYALYVLVRSLGEQGRLREARQVVGELAPGDEYAHELLERCAQSSPGASERWEGGRAGGQVDGAGSAGQSPFGPEA